MANSRTLNRWLLAILCPLLLNDPLHAEEPKLADLDVRVEVDRIDVRYGDITIAEYRMRDALVKRPFWANLKTLTGKPVTRPHPADGNKETGGDHHDMHPGVWIAFGDINGVDFWRNKGTVRHNGLVQPIAIMSRSTIISVSNSFLDEAGNEVCRQTVIYNIEVEPKGWKLSIDFLLQSADHDLRLGAQEEMGIGIRMAPELAEKSGGQLTNDRGDKTAKAAWGKPVKWLDYQKDGVGIRVTANSLNDRPVWGHTRDYGLMVLNPSTIPPDKAPFVIPQGQGFELGCKIQIHE